MEFLKLCHQKVKEFQQFPVRLNSDIIPEVGFQRIKYSPTTNPDQSAFIVDVYIHLRPQCLPRKKWVRTPYQGGINIDFAGYHPMPKDQIVERNTYTIIAFRIHNRSESKSLLKDILEKGMPGPNNKIEQVDHPFRNLLEGKDAWAPPALLPPQDFSWGCIIALLIGVGFLLLLVFR